VGDFTNVELTDQIGDRLLVLFDGHCGFCNGTVRWLARRDRRDRLRFAASGSAAVADLMASNGGVPASEGSVLVFRRVGTPDEAMLTRIPAWLAVLQELPWPWPLTGRLLAWVPGRISEAGYSLIARWRYRIWGRLASCPLPTPAERSKFLT
jgi:predicted DCC family thiol-disulfide oxidoreductase YuxK